MLICPVREGYLHRSEVLRKKLIKVTEIQPRSNSETKWAIVSYEWAYDNLTPFAYLSPKCQEKGAVHTGSYTFTLYDKGWRIEDPAIDF